MQKRDDNGSLAVAMSVLMILANLSVVVLARTMVSLDQVRRGQDFVAALASADGGLSDALFRIDQSTPPSLTGTGSVGQGSFAYLATRLDADSYSIEVKGTIGGSSHAIEATVRREERFPYALFANQGLTFNGNGSFNIYSSTAAGGLGTGEARVGSNRAIVVNSGKGAGDGQDYFAPSGSCMGCPKPTPKQQPYELDPITFPTGATQPCPALGTFTGAVNGMAGVPVVCDQDVIFTGTTTIFNGPLVLYITADHKLSMDSATVNAGAASSLLQIYKDGAGALSLGNGASATNTSAVLYAPATDLTVNGGAQWFGSITVNSMRINGAPNFTLGYDLGLRSILSQNWRVLHWREVPSTSVGL
ncbi:MAG TPA: hypothetical protein VFA94_10260 [Acidimicrobiales bacterium]|nr:hypothetical protein [Acidimicrobiales bacterium]